MSEPWTVESAPSQAGRAALITGANTGLGLQTALGLARRGATVILACRDEVKGAAAAGLIRRDYPDAATSVLGLDLASLASVREAAATLHDRHARLDLLINNAGIMMTPYATTADGFESQFGINHLGHFALTGLLLDLLLAVPGSRVVTVSSNAHRAGRINFDDLGSRRRYGRVSAYGQSKLANLAFTYALDRRLRQAGAGTAALAAHPGTASTDLTRYLPPLFQAGNRAVGRIIAQSASMGALPILRAATDPDAEGGEYYGPGGRFESKGYPVRVQSSARSRDRQVQEHLWRESADLTGVDYPF